MLNITIFGQNGQVAANLRALFAIENATHNIFDVRCYSSKEVDFADLIALKKFLNNQSIIPDFIINAAAYTNVDKAEEERELADLINHQAVAILAQYATKNNVKLIHYSTDYVFDGSGDRPFVEDNTKNLQPLNHYGKTKLWGEQKIIASGCQYLILRTAWVYSQIGKNFVNSMVKLAKEREVLSIVSDQIGCPTYAWDIALHTITIIKQLLNWPTEFPSGIYNLTNLGQTSRYDFALEIFKILEQQGVNLKIKSCKKIKMAEYDHLSRPANCVLDNQKIINLFHLKIRNWQIALFDCINQLNPKK